MPTERSAKGARTAQRILEVAEEVFADKGYAGAGLRDVASRAGIKAAGLYKYHTSKEDLYCAVLDSALAPLKQLIDQALLEQDVNRVAELPNLVTDLFHSNPRMVALFNQALTNNEVNSGTTLMNEWLDELLDRAVGLLAKLQPELSKAERDVAIIALFNVCRNYFLSQPIQNHLGSESILDEEYLRCQKALLARFLKAVFPIPNAA